MMISPELYYEKHLREKGQKEILREILSLKREIGRLKRELEDDRLEPKPRTCPGLLTQI